MKKWVLTMLCAVLLCITCGCENRAGNRQEKNTDNFAGAGESLPETEQMIEDIQTQEEWAVSIIVAINPQIKLYLNQTNIVIGAECLNEDAEAAFSDISFAGVTVGECMEEIVNAAVEKGYLTNGKEISIEIAEVYAQDINGEDICRQAEEAAALAVENHEVDVIVSVKQDNIIEAKPTSESDAPASAPSPSPEPSKEAVATTCAACNGTGIVCDECGGTGIVNCKACNQTGYETCHVCNGSAVIACHGCGGSGKDATSGEACQHCGGSGKITCDACHGSPSKLCTHCGGALKHTCPVCGGNKNCNACGGNGIVAVEQ